jgi:hypothetical protein
MRKNMITYTIEGSERKDWAENLWVDNDLLLMKK